MNRFLFLIFFVFAFLSTFSQTSVIDFITKPSIQMPSLTAIQEEQFRSTFSYEIMSSLFRTESFTMCNEFNFSKINSGFGIGYESNSNDFGSYQRRINLSYNYKIFTKNAVFIPAIAYEGIKYNAFDSIESQSISSYSLIHTSLAFDVGNLTMGFGLKNINQPTGHYLNYEFTVPIKYQIIASHKFFTENRYIDFLQLTFYDDFTYSKTGQTTYKGNNLSLGLNTKYKFLRVGFDVNYNNIFKNYPSSEKIKANYFLGIEKNNIYLYYCYNQTNEGYISSYRNNIHCFTLSANFNLFRKI